MSEKLCRACGNTYPLTDQYWHANARRADGFAVPCRACANARRAELNAAHGVNARGMNSPAQRQAEAMYNALHKLLQQRQRQPDPPHNVLTLRRTR